MDVLYLLGFRGCPPEGGSPCGSRAGHPSLSVVEDTQFRGDRHSAMLGRGAVVSPPCRDAGRGIRGLFDIVMLLVCLKCRRETRHHKIQPRNEESGGDGMKRHQCL